MPTAEREECGQAAPPDQIIADGARPTCKDYGPV